MPSKRTIAFDAKSEEWLVHGLERIHSDGELTLIEEELSTIKASDLQRALREADEFYGPNDYGNATCAKVTDVPEEFYDKDAQWTNIEFEWFENQLTIKIEIYTETLDGQNHGVTGVTQRTIEPLLVRYGLNFISLDANPYAEDRFALIIINLGIKVRGKVLSDIYNAARDIETLCIAVMDGQLSRTTTADLIRGGHANLLVGQEEGHWLDVKRAHYDLKSDGGKISLAQSVARFCNAEDGGLVVVGMNTKRIPGGEKINALQPVPYEQGSAAKYGQIIDRYMFPPPDNMQIEEIVVEGGMLILIDIAPQPEELKPFLVHGAIVDGKIEGSFISIVRRRGEGSIPITAPMIHSSLAAGRALLRGELMDRQSKDK